MVAWMKNSLTVYKWTADKKFARILMSNPNLTDEYLNFDDTHATMAQFVEGSVLLFGKYTRKSEVFLRHLYVNQKNGYESNIDTKSS